MQGLILAAGMGKRLRELTHNNTKCMVEVCGITLIERALMHLEKLQLSRIVIVVGYEGQKLVDFIGTLDIKTPIQYVHNPIYDKTNNIYSLALAKEYLLDEDTLLLESDLIFEYSVLKTLVDDTRDTLVLVDKYESWMDGTCIKIGEDDSVEAFIPGKNFDFTEKSEYYKTVNIYKFSKEFSNKYYVPFLEAYQKALGENEYYEQVLRVITMLDAPVIKAKKLSGQKWYEIDDVQDLDIATSLFADDDEKVELLHSRFGGFWRYPNLIDFCYLVNPYFPPKKLTDEIKASFIQLLTQYPSGMRVNSLIASKNFGVKQEHILVGNGAAELIKCLMEKLSGKIGIIRPSFEEYANRCNKDNCIIFRPSNQDFSYGVDDLIEYFNRNQVDNLVLINPDNPSGNFINKSDIIRLACWCEECNTRLILDESFVDFSNENDSSMIEEDIINRFQTLVIVKSISKSYGVPGIRLGIIVSADEKMISDMKKDVSIWNINSFGEFYMQIMGKYEKDYKSGLAKYRNVRDNFISQLTEIEQLRVIPSQANYVMAEIVNGMTSRELMRILMTEYNILIKDVTSKVNYEDRQFVRLAVRNEQDNSFLVRSLKGAFEV